MTTLTIRRTMFTVLVEPAVRAERVPPLPCSPLTVSPCFEFISFELAQLLTIHQTLSRLVTWSLFLLKPSSRLTPVLRRWLALAAAAAAAVAAGVVVVAAVVTTAMAVAAAVASLLLTRLPWVTTDAGRIASIHE